MSECGDLFRCVSGDYVLETTRPNNNRAVATSNRLPGAYSTQCLGFRLSGFDFSVVADLSLGTLDLFARQNVMSPEDPFDEKEAQQRVEAALRADLNTPHKSLKDKQKVVTKKTPPKQG
jgi:hypothetical protein